MTPDDDRPAGFDLLAQRLGVAPDGLRFLSGLDEAAVARLDALVASAAARDDQELDEALDGTVRFVPRPLRGKVRRMLVPEDER